MSAAGDFCSSVGISVPILCGAMYPCSNPELVAAASEAGALGIVQPLSLVYVYRHEFRAGLRLIRSLTSKPVGMNVIIEKGSQTYLDRMKSWVDIALDENVKFFVTALGNPNWVVDVVHARGGLVFHNTTEQKWAEKAIESNVDGLICVNNRAGGHAGHLSPEEMIEEFARFNLPLICAGGVGSPKQFVDALHLGYAGVQMGTRFIASTECAAHQSYKDAILGAEEEDIVLTTRVTGVPLSVIRTPHVDRMGTDVGWLMALLLRWPRTRHLARLLLNVQSVWKLKRSALKGLSSKDYWQAGKSVSGINSLKPVKEILSEFSKAWIK